MQEQGKKFKEQLERGKQEYREIEMNLESMMIQVQEPPAIGSAKIVCSYCHHRGHRNQMTKPCQLKKCVDYTFCGIKEKHPEYFNKLKSLKVDLKRKQKEIHELENQAKAMEDFSSNSELHFIKNLTPRLYAVDPSYKTNKPKLMRDVRMLRNFLDGKIPKVCAHDPEQLRILLAKCKKNLRQVVNSPDLFEEGETYASVEYCKDMSPVKSSYSADGGKESASKQDTFKLHSKDDTKDGSTLSSESDDCRRKKRKRKRKKIKKKRRHHSSSSSTSENSEDKVRAARLSRHSFTLPHYYHGYPIPFNTGHSGNIQNVALNTSQVHGMHLENTQHPNFANMFYPQTPFPIPFQLPVHSFQAANSNILANSTSSTVTEESRGSYTQNPQSPGRWGGLNTLVNVATHFADTDPKQS